MREIKSDVVVIGAGVAGLAAAAELARRGLTVSLVEARSRLGGRILTRRPRGWNRAVELGAEFIHEGNPALWERVRAYRIRSKRLTPRHWMLTPGGLERIDDVATRIAEVTAHIDEKRIGSASFAAFVRRSRAKFSAENASLARGFIEGFEAAPQERMSARAVAGATLNDHKQFIVPGGYDVLVHRIVDSLPRDRVRIYQGCVVHAVRWTRGAAVVEANKASFAGGAVIVAVPLGVLQAKPTLPGGIHFDPPLRRKAAVIARMGMGCVVRIVFRFDPRKWRHVLPAALRRGSRTDFGFMHSRLKDVPVWWSFADDGVVIGWAGGPAASRLVKRSNRAIADRALGSFGEMLGVGKAQLRRVLRGWEMHNWSRDPFSRGAYSFIVAGQDDAPARLRMPVARTLFFAGEATADGDEIGTVHGALGSGIRAAKEVLRARPQRKSKSRPRGRP